MSFNNKVVLITGASSGIGAAAAIEFAKNGANVAIAARNAEKLQKVAENCAKFGPKPLAIHADVTIDEEAKNMVSQVIKTFGKLDVLVNNAGTAFKGTILKGTILEAYDKTMNINVRAHVNVTGLAAPHLAKTKGNIINISSVAGSSGPRIEGRTPYCVSKAALNHFTRCAAKELASVGVRVNAISPGPVKTDFLANSGNPESDIADMAPDMPLKRVSDAEEIANMILYLAGDKSVGVTGSEFVIDNGFLLVMP